MAESFQLRVVTPRRVLLDEQVREVTAPGTAGEFGVLAEHITFLSTLEIGPLRYKTERGGRTIAVRGGFAEVAENVMTVLADAAELAEEIDTAGAENDLRNAAQRLTEVSPLDPAYEAAQAEQRWAQTRIEVARKS